MAFPFLWDYREALGGGEGKEVNNGRKWGREGHGEVKKVGREGSGKRKVNIMVTYGGGDSGLSL